MGIYEKTRQFIHLLGDVEFWERDMKVAKTQGLGGCRGERKTHIFICMMLIYMTHDKFVHISTHYTNAYSITSQLYTSIDMMYVMCVCAPYRIRLCCIHNFLRM